MCLLHTKDNKAVANSGSGKLIVKWWSIPFSTKLNNVSSCLHLKEIYPTIFSKILVVEN